jgi:hypothetical protein
VRGQGVYRRLQICCASGKQNTLSVGCLFSLQLNYYSFFFIEEQKRELLKLKNKSEESEKA